MTHIHPSAVVDEQATLGRDISVGPFCVVGPNVTLEDGVRLDSHVVVSGHTWLAAGVRVFPFASVGSAPQDLKYAGEVSSLFVGRNTVIREHATLNPGTEGGGLKTTVGANCLLMVGTHVAHDCHVGDNVIMANQATLGGHVKVGNGAVLGGLSAVHQFVRIGQGAMIGGMSGVENDIIPFATALGNRARLSGLNVVGLKRQGATKTQLQALRGLYHQLFERDDLPFQTRITQAWEEYGQNSLAREILDFLGADTNRSICHPA